MLQRIFLDLKVQAQFSLGDLNELVHFTLFYRTIDSGVISPMLKTASLTLMVNRIAIFHCAIDVDQLSGDIKEVPVSLLYDVIKRLGFKLKYNVLSLNDYTDFTVERLRDGINAALMSPLLSKKYDAIVHFDKLHLHRLMSVVSEQV